MALEDPARGTARLALHDGGRLLAALFIARDPVAVMRDYLAGLPEAQTELLSGRTPADMPDPGPVLCSCLGMGINTIITAIEHQGLLSVEDVGDALGAGANCGSCRPEIAELLRRRSVSLAAE